MTGNPPHLYFAKNNLFETAEVLLRNVVINNEDKQLLEKCLWDKALHFDDRWSEERFALLEHCWQQSWLAIRLLQNLHDRTGGDTSAELSNNLVSARKEALFTSLLQCLDQLPPNCCKELKDVFSKVLLSNLISRAKKLPLLKTCTEEALLKSLIQRPGETHLLLQMICCEHEAFKDITKSVQDVYSAALEHCLNSVTDCDNSEKKKVVNLLYALLLLLPPVEATKSEDIGQRLYSLSQSGILDFHTLLTVTGCQRSSPVYKCLTDCEDKRMFRHVSCCTTDDSALLNSVYSVVTTEGKLHFEELCLRVFSTRNHWVEELVNMGCQYVLAEDEGRLKALKTVPALWPAIAVCLWKQLSTRADVLDVITPVIKTCQMFYLSLFSHLQETLSRLRVLTDWLRQESGSCLPDVNAMLSLIRSHSLLYVLQTTTHFVGLDHQKLSSLLLRVEGPESWNFRMFKGFTILFSVFELILKAVDIFNEYEKEDCDRDTVCNKYREDISLPILQLDQRLNKIEPLDFRLELLEDIFVLLFLRSEDFCEDKSVDECSLDENEDLFQPGRCETEDVAHRARKSASLPSPLHKSSSSNPRTLSSSSYPSSSHLKTSSQSRQSVKISTSKISQGFVCYPWLVRDLLSCITSSLDHAETNCDNIDCDRLNKLKDSVEDARWRLDMVCDCDSLSDGTRKHVEEEWVFHADHSSDSDSRHSSTSPTPSHKRKRHKRSDSAIRSESSSATFTTRTTGRRFSSSTTTSISSRASSKLFSTSSNVINLMLSSPPSLLSYFIAREDMDRATQAVQKFEMKGCPADIELNFLKEFSILRKSISEIPYKMETSPSTLPSSTLQTISKSASMGVLGVSLTKLIETFFARTPLPDEVGGSKGVVVLDLAISHAPTLQHSACLLDLALNYLNSSSASPGTSSLKAFTLSLRNVLQEVDGSKSLEEVLLDPDVPLRAPHVIQDLAKFWSSLQECISRFQSVVDSGDDDLADAAYLKLTSCVVTGQGLVKNYQDETKQYFLNQLRSYLSTLWKVMSHNFPQGTKYCILEHDLDKLIGDLVFSEGKDPLDIEAALQPLPINMVYEVVSNCTPTIIIEDLKSVPNTVILNAGPTSLLDCDPFPPEEVSTLLQDLLSCIDCADAKALLSLHNNPAVQRVLASTSRLRQLDWAKLPDGDQLFVFLVNLHNLMWLHAMITLEITEPYGLLSASVSLRDLSAGCVGYQLADDCFISLIQIRNSVLPFPATTVVCSDLSSKTAFTSVPSDPRVLFLLASPYKLGPAVQVLSSQNLDQEVDSCMATYVETAVRVTDDCVTVPVLVFHYLEYTALTQGPESETSIDDDISISSKDNVTDFIRDLLKRDDVQGKDIIINKEVGLTIAKDYSGQRITRDHPLEENTDESWRSKQMRPEVLKYLAARNPLLGSVVEKIHCIESGVESGNSPTWATPLERELMSMETNRLATLYNDNVMLAVLKPVVEREKLWVWFDSAVQRHDWLACLDMISYVPEKQFKADPRLLRFRDYILERLSSSADGWMHCQNISEPQKMCELTLANMDKWSQEGCITLFNILLSLDTLSLPSSSLARARQLRISYQTASHVASACKLTCTDDAWAVVEELIKCEKVSLALQWYQQRDLSSTQHTSNTLLLTGQLVLELLERGQETSALELLQPLASHQAVQVCESIALRAQSVSSLQQITHFLQSQPVTPTQALRYTCLDIGVHMLNYIPWQEQDLYRHLVSQPELLVEQLLMCTRVSTLELVLQGMWGRISTLPPSAPLSPPSLDALLRRYAAKAVDVQVRVRALAERRQPTPTTPSKFTPPDVPPTKEEWVGNDEVTECMCCEASVFSMFNRRHHCRRCGRVVCGVCSLNRLKVSGYGNVKVRICSDCYDYVLPKTSNMDVVRGPRELRTESKCSEPEWWLTKDLVYNATVREEFTYSHAPSISLCLSILKLHSEHSSLLRFLFSTIENMLLLLRPLSPGTVNPEVDYSLLVTMIRSLLEFAKLSCSQHGSHSDWATVDGLFAEVDLLGLLVTSPQTCALLPSEPLRGHSALGSLRENLLKSELWTLALEVSTKAGLDYNSVWVAWGKACLKAGAWSDARDKFAHCNPLKRDTQLLADILQILQDNPHLTDLKSRLCRLKALSSGQDTLQASASLEPRVYEECLYYLRTLGTFASSLTFYLSQNDIKSAVCMLMESPIDTQVYLDYLFLPALKTASVTQLYTCMAEIDKSLVIFKEYLRASCAYCERHKLFHVLYQAQVWMNDNVRAAMTCIHFYRHNARDYRDLAANKLHLEKTLMHLQLALKQIKDPPNPLVMQLRQEEVSRYITTVTVQLEVTVFAAPQTAALTLFGSRDQRLSLAAKIVATPGDLEENLALATKVVEDWSAESAGVLCQAATQLGNAGRGSDVQKLATMQQSDEQLRNQLLSAALKERSPQLDVNPLIELITDVPSKITAFIDCELLLSAYLLAVKNKRLTDIQRILDSAILLDQPRIVGLCRKRLNILGEQSQTHQEE